MRKFLTFAFIAITLMGLTVSLSNTQPAAAQDGGTELVFGEWIEGSITADDFEHFYTFEGKAGDIVLFEMYRKPGEFGLDPELELRDSTGGALAANDDFIVLGSVIVRELAFDGSYTLVARRSGGLDGSSEGSYILRAQLVELVTEGAELTATISSVDEEEIPNVYVIRVDEDTTWNIGFAHEGGELYPTITLESWAQDSFDSISVFELTPAASRSGSLSVDLTAGTFYILSVQQALWSFVFDDMTSDITVTVSAAE